MEIKNMPTNKIKMEIIRSKENIRGYEEALKYLPTESILGRWSIEFSIKYEKKRLNKLNKELSLRIDK